ncbi:MAG: tetratricopeptide repeat protein [Candidatus Thorarchaeota archaeon]
MAREYIADVENEKAIALLEEALDTFTHNPELHRMAGLVYSNLGDHSKAIEHFKKALTLEPSHHQTWWNLGNVYEMKGQFKDAKHAYDQAAEVALSEDPVKAERYREWSRKVPKNLR